MTMTNHDGPIRYLPGWRADDGNCEVAFPGASSGEEAAHEYVEGGEWGEDQEDHTTDWITVWAWRVGLVPPECDSCCEPAIGRLADELVCAEHACDHPVIELDDDDMEEVECDRESHLIAIEPEEPDCDHDDGHDYRAPIELVGGIAENPGCWGHGGGVVYHEVCVRCGLCRTTDTWAQCRHTGLQGLTSVTYREPGDHGYPVDSPDEYLQRVDIGSLEQEEVAEGDGWAIFLAMSPLDGDGRWAVCVAHDEDCAQDYVEWLASYEEALEEAHEWLASYEEDEHD